MTCRELMIGDYIQSHKQIYRVAGIKPLADIELTVMDTDGKLLDMFIDDVEPIPLTEEILKKNNFRVSSLTDNRLTYGDIVLSMLDNSYIFSTIYDDYILGTRPHIDYVHQLQHSLILCEVNKDIEL